MVLPLLAGIAGAGLSYASGSAAADLQSNMQETQWGFQDQLSNQFANDPLMQMALRNVTQQGWDPRQMLAQGTDQINAVGRRRAFDAQRSMAKWGFQPGRGQIGDFMQTALQQRQGGAQDQLRGLIAMQSPMSQLQNQMANALGYSQALGPQIGMASQGMGSGTSAGLGGNQPAGGPVSAAGPGYLPTPTGPIGGGGGVGGSVGGLF